MCPGDVFSRPASLCSPHPCLSASLTRALPPPFLPVRFPLGCMQNLGAVGHETIDDFENAQVRMEAAALTRPLGHVLFTSRACCPVSPATPLCWPAPFPRVSLCPRRRPRCCPFSSTNSSTARSPWALLPRTLRWVLGTKLLFFVVLLLFSVLVFRASTVLLCSLTLLPLVCCRCPLLCGCMQVIFDSGAWEVRGWRLASCLHAAGCRGGGWGRVCLGLTACFLSHVLGSSNLWVASVKCVELACLFKPRYDSSKRYGTVRVGFCCGTSQRQPISLRLPFFFSDPSSFPQLHVQAQRRALQHHLCLWPRERLPELRHRGCCRPDRPRTLCP